MIDRSLNYGRECIRSFCCRIPSAEVVLDLGAGRGEDLKIVGERFPNARLHAVEVYDGYAQELERRAIDVLRIDLERDTIPLKAESVDLIIANQILEHTKELFWIFHEVSRTLRVGGSLIIGVPNLAALHNRVLLAFGRQPSPIKSNSAHVRGFTKGDIFRFLESGFKGGYELRDYAGSNFYPFPPMLARPLARVFPSLAWGIFLRVQKIREYAGGYLQFPVRARLETNFFLGRRVTNREVTQA